MSDQSKFANAYIETTVATLHDYMNQLLQTKAHLKVATDIVTQLQSELAITKTELDQCRINQNEKDSVIHNLSQLEHTNHALQNKAAHLDTALNQISEMKKMIIQKDDVIKNLELQIQELRVPKKVINKKKSIQTNVDSIVKNTESELTKTDDF